MRIAIVLSSLLALAACSREPQPQSAVGRGAAFLWKQQAPDGGWHSHTYGLLRSGQSMPTDKLDQALAYIRSHRGKDGSVGMNDPSIPDYPNYSTALAIHAIVAAHRNGFELEIAPMIAYLRTQQFTEDNGWHPKDLSYGAWGMGGGRRTPPDTGHVDLSMSGYVIDALRAGGIPESDPALKAARIFVERCQNFDPHKPDDLDGGFFFTTTEFDTNKAGQEGKHYRSYGTTTADGIVALIALGTDRSDPRIVSASRWLTANHKGMGTPGFNRPAHQRWIHGLAFYYSSASMAAFKILGKGPAPGVVNDLQHLQKPDGSWANTENLVKEDDPLIATGFALRALTGQ
jgi:squalene-hopene/tetraprenyl-beta-curcumene cyclase